jgi:hypothetical protein
MQTLNWLVVFLILIPLIILLYFKGHRWAEKGNYGPYIFSIIFGLYFTRNAFLLLTSGGWASELKFGDSITIASLLASGWVDLLMNLLVAIALLINIIWTDVYSRKARQDDELRATLKKLNIDPAILVELCKTTDYEIRINLIITDHDRPAISNPPERERIKIYKNLNRKTLQQIMGSKEVLQ